MVLALESLIQRRKGAQRLFPDFIFGADDADDDTHFATAYFSFQTPGTDSIDDVLDLLFGRIRTGDNDHCD